MKIIKFGLLGIFSVFFLACNNTAPKTTTGNNSQKTAKDSSAKIMPANEIGTADSPTATQNKPSETLRQNSDVAKKISSQKKHQSGFEKFLNDPKTPKFAKAFYLGKVDWNKRTPEDIYNLYDSLANGKTELKYYYFKVLAEANVQLDGGFAEGDLACKKRYTENNIKEFLSYFNHKGYSDKDLEEWAIGLSQGLSLDIWYFTNNNQNKNKSAMNFVNAYINKLKAKCKDCSPSATERLNKFCEVIRSYWQKRDMNISPDSVNNTAPPHPILNR